LLSTTTLSKEPPYLARRCEQKYPDTYAIQIAQSGLHVVTKPQGYKSLCGFVNGRNGFGGYTGFQPFLASLDAVGHVRSATFVGPYVSEGSILDDCGTDTP
jgi:hypothetical protein